MHCHIVLHLGPLQLVHQVPGDELYWLVQVEPARHISQSDSRLQQSSVVGHSVSHVQACKQTDWSEAHNHCVLH